MHLLLPFLFVFLQSSATYQHSDWDVNVRSPKEFHAAAGCSQFEVTPSQGTVARSEESFTLPSALGLVLSFGHYGGAYVEGSTRSDIRVTACKAAGGMTADESAAALSAIKIGHSPTIGASGHGKWLVYFIVEAPRGAHLNLAGDQGPMYVRDFTGNLIAANSSGPMKLSNVNGEIRGRVTGGPLAYSGSSGDVRISTDGGPLKVDFLGSGWTGGKLNASAEGPVKISVPDDYRSKVDLYLTGDAPVKCRSAACRNSHSWDHLTLGNGEVAAVINGNGPASIDSKVSADNEDF
jgi:hypothetical protein